MTAALKYKQCKTWRGRVRLIYLYHSIRLARDYKWTLAQTAKYFDISLGATSEALTLAMHLDKVRKIKNRREAVEYIKRRY